MDSSSCPSAGESSDDASRTQLQVAQGRHKWRMYWRRLRRRPAALVGTCIFCVFLLLAVIGPYVAPYSAIEQNLDEALSAPSFDHPFGTDRYGRDILSRVIVGSRGVFLLGGMGTLIATVVGTALGLLSGYKGGLLDEVFMRGFDVLLSFPALLLALVLLATTPSSPLNLVLVVAILYTPVIARVARSVVLDVKTREFVEVARMRGETSRGILFREIMPNAYPPLLVEASMRFGYSIFMVASLGFLGLGVQPPSPDWGLQINEGRDFFSLAPWVLVFPACAIALLIVGTNLMTDGLRHMLQPGGGADA